MLSEPPFDCFQCRLKLHRLFLNIYSIWFSGHGIRLGREDPRAGVELVLLGVRNHANAGWYVGRFVRRQSYVGLGNAVQ